LDVQVVDYFKPVDGASWCNTLTSHNQHVWSQTGLDGGWVAPAYISDPAHRGGSAADYPKNNVKTGCSRFNLWQRIVISGPEVSPGNMSTFFRQGGVTIDGTGVANTEWELRLPGVEGFLDVGWSGDESDARDTRDSMVLVTNSTASSPTILFNDGGGFTTCIIKVSKSDVVLRITGTTHKSTHHFHMRIGSIAFREFLFHRQRILLSTFKHPPPLAPSLPPPSLSLPCTIA
jgi:hypothetical protein